MECLALGTLFGAGAGILGAHLGWVNGAIELGALAGLAAIVSGLLLDTYVIHPIADNNFQKDVEFPLVQKFLGIATDIAEVSDEDLKKIALKSGEPPITWLLEFHRLGMLCFDTGGCKTIAINLMMTYFR